MHLYDHQNDNVFPLPFLPFELIIEILLRLPARSLLQLRRVCKLWKTLISDPILAKKHFLISTADPNMNHQRLAFSNYKTCYSYPLKSLFEHPSSRVISDSFSDLKGDYYMLGSCNGLLCLFDEDQWSVIMYNPASIGLKSKCSPKFNPLPDWVILYYGFGYDYVNNKYKLLAVVENYDSSDDDEDFGESLTKIYTFGENSWRTIQDLPYTPLTQYLGKYVSGTLNWIGRKLKRCMIISFDLDKETYRDVLLPQNVPDCDFMCRPSLCVLNDSLCLCYVNKTHLVAWLMKEYGVVDSWTKLLNIPREKLSFLNSIKQYSIIDLLFISENGIVLLMVSSQFFLYNLNSGVLDHPLITINIVFDPRLYPQIYCENLISP
ncbi:hypothetical protein TSUD_191430 [Trifolium subterraneum]|uniref:F-box domain-containing protein n=1 Tax=Trifolium subterraneum TaxID=3900 RepID=A0A2Z6NY76_TRISU|nr:hypothetical protein TSUD_191430 [Trifolium subterraneum]